MKVDVYKYCRPSHRHRPVVNYAFDKYWDLSGGNRMFHVPYLEGVRVRGISTFASHQLLNGTLLPYTSKIYLRVNFKDILKTNDIL